MSKEAPDFCYPPAEKLQNFFGVFLQFQIGVDKDGISELCNDDFDIYTDGALESNWIRLCKNKENHQTYLAVGLRDMGSASPIYQRYYSLVSGEWVRADDFGSGRHDVVDENGTWLEYRWSWHVPSETDCVEYGDGELGKPITDEEYEAAVGKYVDYQDILSSGTKFHFKEGGGFLSELFFIKLTVNGEPVELGTQPFAEKGVFMAPVRPVLEAMGVAVYAMSKDTYADTWVTDYSRDYIKSMSLQGPPMVVVSTKKQTVSIRTTNMLDDNFVANHPGDYYADYGDKGNTSPAPHMAGGNMVAPISKMVGFFGGKVVWDAMTRTLAVTGSIPEADRMSEEEIKSMATFSSSKASSIMESKGYQFYDCGWAPDSYHNGKKYWTFVVLPQGAEFEVLPDDNPDWPYAGPTNATNVTVGSDGSVSWGDAYYKDIV